MSKYGEWKKNYLREYRAKVLCSHKISYKKDYYEASVEPAIIASGMPFATFAKEAIMEKIKRDYPQSLTAPRGQKYYIRTSEYDMVATYDGSTARWLLVKPQFDPSKFLLHITDTDEWDEEHVDNFEDFFGIGTSATVLAQAPL